MTAGPEPQSASSKSKVRVWRGMYIILYYICAQENTKAKKRYLKAKKDRRKKRKAQPTIPETAAGDRRTLTPHESDSDPEEQGSSEESDIDEDVALHAVCRPKVTTETTERSTKGRKGKDEADRPRKRRKVESEEGRTEHVDDVNVPSRSPTPQARPKSPTPPTTLPIFPLPTRPDAPSKQTLALQGLDKALIEAELVNPAKLQPFPTAPDDDGGTGLSERTRKRLQELGITELFAGLYDIPHLAHSDYALTAANSADICHSVPPHSRLSQVTILAV